MDVKPYKILFADDEYWTREKMRTVIKWEEYGLVFMEPAVDGEDVLEKIKAEQPDILITDINMPFLNGVELLKLLKKEYPDLITFVISGYDDFDYVRDTFMAGAIHYLMKPVTKIDLINALSKAFEIISSRQNEREEEKWQKQELLKASSLIQDREFSLLVEKEDSPFTPSITMNSDMDFAGASLVMVKIHQLKTLAGLYRYDMNLLSYHIKKEIRGWMEQEGVIVFNHIYRSNEFIVVTEMENARLKEAAKKITVYLSKMAKSPVTVCISEHSYTMDSIHMAYVQVVSLFMTRSYTNRSEILITSKNDGGTSEIRCRIGEGQEQQLKSLLRNGNKGAVRKIVFEEIGLTRCQEERWEYLEVKQTVKKIWNLMYNYTAGRMQAKELVDLESMADQADKIIESLDSQALCEILESVIDCVIPGEKEAPPDSIRGVVKQAVLYIGEHYFEDLSLAVLARQFNVEGSYFSKVFRQETNETVMVYITRLRMERAKEHMKNPSVSLIEIAFMVGYDDYTYFSRVFRKVVGSSPREFRNHL